MARLPRRIRKHLAVDEAEDLPAVAIDPEHRGAPAKPTVSRWRRNAWTVGVHGPVVR